MKRVASVTAVLLALCFVAGAQDAKPGKVASLWHRLCGPSPLLDSTRIFQPFKGWGAGVVYSLTDEQVHVISEGNYTSAEHGGHLYSVIDLYLLDGVGHSVGVYGRYGPIQLGFNRHVGREQGYHRTYNLKWLGNFFCLDARYVSYQSLLGGDISMRAEGYPNTALTGYRSSIRVDDKSFATVSMAVINGIYAFNRKRFSYRAAYNGRVVQRRSAGSFLVAAKYMYGNFQMDASDKVLVSLVNGLARFETSQFSLGAGYSFNWVPYHRDAVSPHDLRGLRNLTVNVTAVPMLTLLNAITSHQYAYESKTFDYVMDDAQKYRMYSRIQPNFTARAAICYNTGRFYVNVWADYTRFVFRNRARTFSLADGDITLAQHGEFSSWMVNLQLNYRF